MSASAGNAGDGPARPPDRRMLLLAARAAARAAGDVEPNPLVGCVIAREEREGWRILGVGHHRRFGGPHAEAEALEACARSGASPRGATVWVTLEPCAHRGKTPPCADALVAAGVGEVVYARADPNPEAAGGAAALSAAGVRVRRSSACPEAEALSDSFVKRITTGLPWVIAKWAQTIDGRIATRSGESRWISCETSRRRVHALRARVDAVLTGAGTVVADDPLLTARDVGRVRRVARRVVVDPMLRIPDSCALLRSLAAAPVTIAVSRTLTDRPPERVRQLRSAGVEVVGLPETTSQDDALALEPLLRHLAAAHGATNVLVEAGPALTGALLREGLVDELRVFTAPMVLGDRSAVPPADVGEASTLAGAGRWRVVRVARSGKDTLTCYRRAADQGASSAGRSAPG